jgi:release factor glutamine methyltransferase
MPAPDALTLAAALRWGARQIANSPTAMLDACVLMKAALNIGDEELILQDARVLAPDEAAAFEAMIARRSADEPVAYITGIREFWSLPIAVEPGILVPRADSETLIAAVLERRDSEANLRILDLGCGSGALICALLSSMPAATGVGVDISESAVALTNRNLAALGLATRGRAVAGNWTAGLSGRFDIVISNPPYIAEGDRGTLQRDVVGFEDPRALFAGVDGLDAYRALSGLLADSVAEDGLIALELGAGQAVAVAALFRPFFPFGQFAAVPDLAGTPRALIIDLRRAPGYPFVRGWRRINRR